MPDPAGFCLSDEKSDRHPSDRDCKVHCLLASGGDGAAVPAATPQPPRLRSTVMLWGASGAPRPPPHSRPGRQGTAGHRLMTVTSLSLIERDP